MSVNRLPVTVVTGFLGSGKTTLLRHLLSEGNQRLAVVVNEFGTVGLDGDLLKNCGFCTDDEVDQRVEEILIKEAEVTSSLPWRSAIH